MSVSGRVDAFRDRQMILSIERTIDEADRVALDLSEAEFLSLQMLKFLTHLNQVLGRKGGELALVRPTHSVRRQIDIFVGSKILKIYRSLEDLQLGYRVQPRAEFHAVPTTESLFS